MAAFVIALTVSIVRGASGQPLESPRLRTLQVGIAQEGPRAIEAFWREIASNGAPLIERVNERQGYALVTFVWRGEAGTTQVFVDGQLGQLTGTRRADNAMVQLNGTSVWYRSYWLRHDLRTVYRFVAHHGENSETKAGFYADPFGKPWLPSADVGRTSTLPRLERSFLELPHAVPQPWLSRSPDRPAGRTEQRTWKSDLLKNERRIWVYTPANYRRTGERPWLLVTTDGAAYMGAIDATATLDNLIAARRIPPVIAVFIDNAPNVARDDGRLTRSIELSCNERFVDFLATEILPWVRSQYYVAASASRTVIAGFSLGGVNAAFTALRRPDLFGNVLSQSGAFWWRPPGEPESEWLTKQFAVTSRKNVNFYLDVGLLEAEGTEGAPMDWLNTPDQPVPYGPSMVLANRHLRDVLRLKGYKVHYGEFAGGHHALSWRGTFADGITALIGDRRRSRDAPPE